MALSEHLDIEEPVWLTFLGSLVLGIREPPSAIEQFVAFSTAWSSRYME
jgi:hypothetical protein